ncbi:MAG: DMT family transporter [Pseudomonadales bacterium]|nr:DMT family transporter [Pseudomonadales bacterium]
MSTVYPAIRNTYFSKSTVNYLMGLVAVLAFALTGPLTSISLQSIDATFSAAYRTTLAGILAAIILTVTKSRFPDRQEYRWLIPAALCVAIGFPYFTSYAMRHTGAIDTGIVFGIIPVLTALCGIFIHRRQMVWKFWLWACCAALIITVFYVQHGLRLSPFLLCAAVVAAIGYTAGSKCAQTLGGWQTISWSVVFLLPINGALMISNLEVDTLSRMSISSFFANTYLGVVSQWLGFFLWYRALSEDIQRVSQIQVLQPVATAVFATLLLNESLSSGLGMITGLLIICLLGCMKSGQSSKND